MLNLLILLVTIVLSVLFLILLFTSKEYNNYIEPLDDTEFPIKEIYCVGFSLSKILNIDYKSKFANTLRQEIGIVYGEKYCEFYLRVIYAQRFSICWLVLIVSGVFASFATGTDVVLLYGIGIMIVVVLYYYFSTNMKTVIQKKSALYLKEFPSVVSTIALLVNAGMMLREAWTEVAFSAEGELYEQMKKVSEDMDNGVSESDALNAFAIRCATPEIKKFTSFIIQGFEKGNKDLAFSLKNQSDELWEMRKQKILQQGDLAASKLLIPIMVMFVGILIMVMGPIMTNLGF